MVESQSDGLRQSVRVVVHHALHIVARQRAKGTEIMVHLRMMEGGGEEGREGGREGGRSYDCVCVCTLPSASVH